MVCWANRDEARIAHRDRLKALSGDTLTVVHVLSRPEADWSVETGHLDGDLIARRAGHLLLTATAFVCGPPALIGEMIKAWRKWVGLPTSRILHERFAL